MKESIRTSAYSIYLVMLLGCGQTPGTNHLEDKGNQSPSSIRLSYFSWNNLNLLEQRKEEADAEFIERIIAAGNPREHAEKEVQAERKRAIQTPTNSDSKHQLEYLSITRSDVDNKLNKLRLIQKREIENGADPEILMITKRAVDVAEKVQAKIIAILESKS